MGDCFYVHGERGQRPGLRRTRDLRVYLKFGSAFQVQVSPVSMKLFTRQMSNHVEFAIVML